LKLTKQKLYDLIEEVFARGQTPRRYGAGVNQLAKASISDYTLADGKLKIGWFEQNVGKRLGSGYSRMVFAIDLNRTPVYNDEGQMQDPHMPNLVLKVAYNGPQPNSRNEGIKSNLLESELFNKYPHCFPKSYGTIRNGEMIVMEEVVVVETRAHYDEVLHNSFPTLQQGVDYLHSQDFNEIDVPWLWEKMLDSWDEVIQPALKVPFKGPEKPNRWEMFGDEVSVGRRTRGMTDEQKLNLWYIVTNDTKLMNWITDLRYLGVEFDEIRVGNVGTNTLDNKLFLIDVSKF
tara:strand:+ start:1089 stop:1955 length:867 start_codon:yes stop_codon:yes gene_type:complete